MLVSGISILVFASLKGEQGFLPCIWVFGVFSGGYHYSLKMYVFEKVRARNFARAWGFLQASQVTNDNFKSNNYYNYLNSWAYRAVEMDEEG